MGFHRKDKDAGEEGFFEEEYEGLYDEYQDRDSEDLSEEPCGEEDYEELNGEPCEEEDTFEDLEEYAEDSFEEPDADYGDGFEESDADYEDDYEDLDEYGTMDEYGEDGKSSRTMVIIGVALLAIIIVLCLLIWQLLHKDNEQAAGTPGTGTQATESVSPEGTSEEGDILAEEQESSSGSQEEVKPSGESDADSREEEESEGSAGNTEGGSDNAAEDGDGSAVAMSFQEVSETVTAKELTNLRSEPGTEGGNTTVVTQLLNGETATRTGINRESGWSRVEYKGQVLYASSSLLTTDLTAQPPAEEEPAPEAQEPQGETGQTVVDGNTVTTKSGRTITFTVCDDTVSPKMEVNLRGEPSTDQGNDTIHHRLMYGETAHRTGYDEASGWSRVEYEGEVLYAVTSYLFVVEETEE